MYFQEQIIINGLREFLEENDNGDFPKYCKNGICGEVTNIIYHIAQEEKIELGKDRIIRLKPIIKEIIEEYVNTCNGILIA